MVYHTPFRKSIVRILLFATAVVAVSTCFGQLTYKRLRVVYDTPWTYKNLQLIPIRYKGAGGGVIENAAQPLHQTISLQEAMTKGKLKIKEVKYQNGSDINVLQVKNISKDTVLINSGEMLGGGKQDRMIAETKILKPGKKDYINVYCIEQGRWDKKPKRFTHQGNADSDLRKVMHTKKRQQEVWKAIQRSYKAEYKRDENWSYQKLRPTDSRVDTGYLNYFRRKFAASDSLYAGFVFITADRIMSVEAFDKAEMTTASYISMLQGVIPTAINNGSTPTLIQKQIQPFLDNIFTTEPQQKTFVEKRGKIDRDDGRVIHLVAFGD